MILGIDWLSQHQVIVDCRMKRVILRTPNDDEVIFIGERSNHLSNVISTATDRKMVRKGCETYLDYVIDTVKARPSVSNIPTVSDFPDIFLEEFPGIEIVVERTVRKGIYSTKCITMGSSRAFC